MGSSPQRVCPHCGTPVAQRAEDCLACGAHLKEQKRPVIRLPQGNLWLPVLLVVTVVILWLWKPWQSLRPKAAGLASAVPSATLQPSATRPAAPTATPLSTAVPSPTPTLPPNQTLHTVKKGETLISIAKLYGTTAAAIRTANNMKSTTPIHEGDQLIVPLLAANTPTPTPTPAPTPTPVVYVVVQNDTLSAIAKRFGTTVEALMRANGISDATGIHAGTRLTIPVAAPTAVPVVTYEVKAGDTLSGIAAKFKVSVAQIKQANGLKSDLLQVGQKLKITGADASLVPTATEEPSPVPSPTSAPLVAMAYAAPALLAPQNGAAFAGGDTVILLNWASVGILGEEEWYVLRMRRAGPLAEQLPLVWTKATSWRLPGDLHVAGTQEFFWQVSIMRKTGEKDDGTWLGEEISARSERRTLAWQ
jgi:LysM repeat protein